MPQITNKVGFYTFESSCEYLTYSALGHRTCTQVRHCIQIKCTVWKVEKYILRKKCYVQQINFCILNTIWFFGKQISRQSMGVHKLIYNVVKILVHLEGIKRNNQLRAHIISKEIVFVRAHTTITQFSAHVKIFVGHLNVVIHVINVDSKRFFIREILNMTYADEALQNILHTNCWIFIILHSL